MFSHRRGHCYLLPTTVSRLLSHVNGRVALVEYDLVGVQEIAEMIGVTRQRIHAISRTHEDFPKPVAELAAGRIWTRKEIEEWARRTGRFTRKNKRR